MQTEAKIVLSNSELALIENEAGEMFQFCKYCKEPSHFRAFVAYFCPEVKIADIDGKTARRFERRLYQARMREVEDLIHFETGKVAAYIDARFSGQDALTPETQEYLKRLEKDFFG